MNERHLFIEDNDVPACMTAARHFSAMEDRVREIFILCYRDYSGDFAYGNAPIPAWDGGTDRFGKRYKPIWPKIVAKLVALGADPISFIRAQFGNEEVRRPPRPNQLLSETAVAAWRTFEYTATEELINRRRREDLALRRVIYPLMDGAKWDYRKALGYALTAPVSEVAASPLYRHCAAVANDMQDIAKYFHDRGLVQYVFQKSEYDTAWGDIIPEALRTEAEALRVRLTTG